MTRRLIAIASLALLFGLGMPARPAPPTVRPATRPVAAVVTPNGSWTTYHHDNGHTGYDAAAPALGPVGVTPGWTETALDGQVYAEPLVYNGVVYATTLNNTVYALNQADGTQLWMKNLGTPVSGGWQCPGNVNPQGILGTGVIDTAANRIYVATILNSDHVYHVFGLDLGNLGNVVMNTGISITGFDWTDQQQRGALSLANGYVYVPFGGKAGDCGPYHGYVVGVPTSGATSVAFYQTPSTGSGIWAAGGIVVDSATGSVFAATGNGVSSGCGTVNQNDAVVRLSPTLALQGYFMPADWQANWCQNDQDLGSASPLLISSSLLFQSGKWGGGFLLNPNALGGVNGQRFPSPTGYSQAEVCLGNHAGATFGSFAYAAPFIYVECEGRGLMALNVNTSTPSFDPCPATCGATDWHVLNGTTLGPPIVAAGAVWAAVDGGGLYAFNAATGAQIFHSANFGVNRFVTPAEAGGQVFVPSHTVIKSFSFAASVSLTPARLDFNGQAPGGVSNPLAATLHNTGTTTVHVSAVALSGANAGQYFINANVCTGQTVAPGGACSVTVAFRPMALGGFPASLVFTDDAPGSPQSVPLGGLGAIDNQAHLYTLDGYGGIHPVGSSPARSSSAYWPGWNIARSIALFPDGLGGYVLDGYGGLHPVGNASQTAASAYWSGWDIARQVVLAPWSSMASPAGWTLDGWGGLHPFGGAPAVAGTTYWQGWDIARGLVILPDSTPSAVAGYTLDGYGGLHPFGGAAPPSGASYWGWDIARGITLSPNASKSNAAGWVLDGYGGIHPFGSAPAFGNFPYWGWDIGRGLVTWTGGGSGGWVLDGYGGIHPVGTAPAISGYPYWGGWDIATSLAGSNFGTGSRRRS